METQNENAQTGDDNSLRTCGDTVANSGNLDTSAGDSCSVNIEEIPGLDEETARTMGLLNSADDYAAQQAAKIAEAEAFDHVQALEVSTLDMVLAIRNALDAVKAVGDNTNKAYGKFMVLGMHDAAKYLQEQNANVHFNALIESLEECRARACLLRTEFDAL